MCSLLQMRFVLSPPFFARPVVFHYPLLCGRPRARLARHLPLHYLYLSLSEGSAFCDGRQFRVYRPLVGFFSCCRSDRGSASCVRLSDYWMHYCRHDRRLNRPSWLVFCSVYG